MFFSIIIPVYNVAPYLRECLDSVLAQTFTDWETICVDDGSTDGSDAILDEYGARDRRFRVIHQSNAGVSAARNKALDEAHGEWLCFLDADDKVECHWLENIAKGAKRHPEADWIRTSFKNWDEGQEPQPWSGGHEYTESLLADVVRTAWNMVSCAAIPSLNIVKRGKVKEVRFQTNLKYCEDSCFILDYLRLSNPHAILTLPNDDYCYRLRNSSASHSMKCADVTASLESVLKRWRLCKGKWGAFTFAVERYLFRCVRAGRTMSRQEAAQLQSFIWRASWCGFFSPFSFSSKKKQIRWLLFMMFGNPQVLFGKMGLNWLLPNKWAKEEKR